MTVWRPIATLRIARDVDAAVEVSAAGVVRIVVQVEARRLALITVPAASLAALARRAGEVAREMREEQC